MDNKYSLSDPNHIKFDDIPIQVLNSIRDIVFYNDLTDKIKKWKIVGEFDDEHEAVPLDEWFTEQHAIWMMCVGMFGDFGTSPRSGWIENKKDFDKFIDYITQDEQPQE